MPSPSVPAGPPGIPPGPALRIVGVSKRFGSSLALDGVELAVERGEYLCVLGPSGSGKSTLLRIVGGFEAQDLGEVHLGGAPADGVPPEGRNVHTVFQGYALFPHLSVAENVAFGLRMRSAPEAEIADRVQEILALVGLEGYGPRRPGTLSGGEQQRVALARALVNRPSLLLLDEPLAALDRKLRLRMQDELARIQAETGIAFVHVTHDQEEALRLADRIAVMDRGRLLQVGPPAEVYRRPRSAFVAGFLGAANVFRAEAGERAGDAPDREEVERRGGLPIRVVGGPDLVVEELSPAGLYAIRPEALILRGAAGGEAASGSHGGAGGAAGSGGGGPNRIPGRVVLRASTGSLEELGVRVGEEVWTVHLLGGAAREPIPVVGDEVALGVHPADVIPLEG